MIASRVLRATSSASTIASASTKAARLPRGKTTTELTGLAVHHSPLQTLDATYKKTLSFLDALPAESVYRQASHAVTTSRYDILKKAQEQHRDALSSSDRVRIEEAIKDLEQSLDAGLIEEVIIQAEDELNLSAKMLEWKAHEPLEVTPAPHQWSYFDMAEEAATNE